MVVFLFASSCLQHGEVIPNSVAVGDKVLVPEYGGTKVVFDDQVRLKLPTRSCNCDRISCRITSFSVMVMFWVSINNLFLLINQKAANLVYLFC